MKKIDSGKRVRPTTEKDDNPWKKESTDPVSDRDDRDGFAENKRVISVEEEEDDTPFKRMRREEKKVFVVKPITYYKKDSEESESGEEEESNSESEDEISDPRSNYDWDGFSENEYCQDQEESDEDIIRDRKEKDHGYNIVLKQGRTITNPRRPQKTYIPRSSKHCHSVLYHLDQPLVVFAKLALARYNAIQGKNYEYYALVKAYNIVVGGFVFWIRFKAFLTAQDPIDFEAVVYQGIPDKPKSGQKRRDCEAYNIVVGGFVFWIRFKALLRGQDPIDFEAVVYQGIPAKPKPGQKRRDCEVDIKFVYPLP
ncbi:hypothetical protein POM88_052645 [Heracleum sosnowskyi]|uniref:Uncharacterized protein n=1 Tax=Heracleum sosnowskyi TaxID=360622 RepID=A0AAD8GPV1_9APIA|nr:hypothetical protein POM88_052645 [Heracleum sosnowskyi]